jgi:hypothetical protein
MILETLHSAVLAYLLQQCMTSMHGVPKSKQKRKNESGAADSDKITEWIAVRGMP